MGLNRYHRKCIRVPVRILRSTQVENSNWVTLNFSKNRLQEIPKYQFVRIFVRHVDLSHNRIVHIHEKAFAMSDYVETLRLNDNKLKSLSDHAFSLLPKLQYLDLSGNPLEAVDFDAILPLTNNLKILRISRIPAQSSFFNELKLSSSSGVQELEMKENGFTSLQTTVLKQLPHLKIVDLSGNAIESISDDTFEHNPNLTSIYLANNSLKSVPQFVSKSVKLLDLSGNKINAVEMFAFAEVPSLQKVLLQGNNISSVDHDAFCGSNLSVVNLTYNKLKFFPSCALNTTSSDHPLLLLEYNPIVCNCSVSLLDQSPSWSVVVTVCKDEMANTTMKVQDYLANFKCEHQECPKHCDEQRRKPKSILKASWKVSPVHGSENAAGTLHLSQLVITIMAIFV
ncbi:hypothetical protein ACOME3_008346 [Neoechinorhynchus agilis]